MGYNSGGSAISCDPAAAKAIKGILSRPPSPPPPWRDALDSIESLLRAGDRTGRELDQIRATILVNFGPKGRLNHACAVTDTDQTTFEMFFELAEALAKPHLDRLEQEKS